MFVEKRILAPFAHGITEEFRRADLEFYGIDHLRPTFECLVFFNKKNLDEENLNLSKRTYAGNFTVFGHVDCWGGDGHCQDGSHRRRFDHRPSHPMTRAFKRLVVTRALRHAIKKDPDQLWVTLVVRTREHWEPTPDRSLLRYRGIQLTTFA